MKESDMYERISRKLGKAFLEIDLASVDRHGITPGESVYIWGPIGTGKTQLAVVLLLDYGRFTADTVDGIVDEAKATWGDRERSEKSVIDRYKKAESYVLLDDLLATGLDKHGQGVVLEIVNYRWANALPTLITSNLDLKTIAKSLDDRLISRIAGLCKKIVYVGGTDRRI